MEPANMKTSPFSVMVKPVGSKCNLSCSYCYYSGDGRGGLKPSQGGTNIDSNVESSGRCSSTEFGAENPMRKTEVDSAPVSSENHVSSETMHSPAFHRMSDKLLEHFIRQYIEDSPGPVVSFTWHGGEPMLAGLDFYRLAVRLQKKYLPEGWSCWNNLQTNGVLLNDEWCRFLAEEHFDVGVSLDGTKAVHDRYRRDQAGNGSWDRVRTGVRLLQTYGIQPDLLCTVTSTTAQAGIGVYHALRELKTGWLQFIPIVRRFPGGGVTEDSVTPEAYGRFLCEVFDEWKRNDIGRLEVQLFAETALVSAGGTSSLCVLSPTCGRVLIVEQDGSVYSCDHFVNPKHRIGEFKTNALGQLVDSPQQCQFAELKQQLPPKCKKCPWLKYCNGGCPKDRFLTGLEGEAGLYYLCEGLRAFYGHAEKDIGKIMELRRQGLPPGEILSIINAEEQRIWKGISRNDPCPCGSGRKAKQCCWNKRPAK